MNGVFVLFLVVASVSVRKTDLQEVIGDILVFHRLVGGSAH